jgi:site-specific DNA recombinase
MTDAIGYLRVSTEQQAKSGLGLEAQRAKIEAWCVAHDHVLTAVFEDCGISGSSVKNRDGLAAALSAATQGMILVVYSFSRLARSFADLSDIGRSLKKKKVNLVSVTEQMDTTTAIGRAMFGMIGICSELERDWGVERTTAALAALKARGVKLGTPNPYAGGEATRALWAARRVLAQKSK